MKEYQVAKGWKRFLYIVGPLGIAIFLWFIVSAFLKFGIASSMAWLMFLMLGPMMSIFIFGLISMKKEKLIINDERVVLVKVFSRRELSIEEIKGYRVIDGNILIEPLSEDKKSILVSAYYGNLAEILLWFAVRFPDLRK